MKKVLLFVLLASLFVGCNWELKPKDEVKNYVTVHITDVGSIQVEGEVTYVSNNMIIFKDIKGIKYTTHLHRCIIVDSPFPPVPPAVKAPVAKPEKVNEEKPSK